MTSSKRILSWLSAALVGALCIFQTGCATVTEVGIAVAQGVGVITSDEAKGITRSAKAVGKTLKDITPEQEYYIGRAVAASILTEYQVVEDEDLLHYVNQIGQSLALASEKPQTFKGYHFLVFDADELNAFACPGGLILISRGILQLCENEDQLAAVLAHEVGHIQLDHGLKAISKNRLASALTTIATESAKAFAGEGLGSLTDAFEGSINDITGTLVNKGYARKQEYQADEVAVTILARIGYEPTALQATLEAMNKGQDPAEQKKGFGATHPPPSERILKIAKLTGPAPEPVKNWSRQKRFSKAMRSL